ncbi:MAG TPA: TlpA disulfide reductase family protein [Ignavibacteriaceae bacterium]|nr:TlpA disulfide reductase family protein [Ignavibacteriaceae bacterium]
MKYLLLCFLLIYNFSFSQDVIINTSNIKQDKATLFSLSGEKLIFIDTLLQAQNIFKCKPPHPGIYKLVFSKKNSISFFFDNSDLQIEIDTSYNSTFVNSKENNDAINFLKLNKEYSTKSELLRFVITNYTDKDDYLQITQNKLNEVQENYLNFLNVVSQKDSKSFVARYIKSSQLPIVQNSISNEDYLLKLKTHALDNINFQDEELIYSNVFTNKTIEYLSYFKNPQLPLPLLEKEFEIAIDSVLNKARVNAIVYKHIVEYLLDGFKNFGFDNILNYIVKNYVINDDLCLDEKLTAALDRRIQQAKFFKNGIKVPDIVFANSLESGFSLNNINAEKTLIIFYASWCPHCQTLLPQINDIYKNQTKKTFEVLAISLDTVQNDWINYINKNNYQWLNVSDFQGWNGKAASDYYIYATPTLFLIDKNKNLISIIAGIEELKSYL